jgi:Zn-dependent protease/CBS domain-containing protein
MPSTRWRLFRLLGIPIRIDVSWFIILVLLTGTLLLLFRQELPDVGLGVCSLLALGTALIFFSCIVLHELGHALVARAIGIPIRGITLFLFGGVAEFGGEPESAWSEFIMAAAGPVVSAVLTALFAVAAVLGSDAGWPAALLLMLGYLAFINLMILMFNMVPAFPLDGGRILRAILWGLSRSLRRSTRWASFLGRAFAWVLIAVGMLQFLDGHLFQGVWLTVIGVFLNHAARASYEQVLLRQALLGEPVSRFMTPSPIVVPPSTDLRHWVEDYVYRFHRKAFPVTSNGHVEGVISTPELARFPHGEWERHTVAEVMRRDVEALSIPPDGDALDALARMQRTGSNRLLVTDHDHLVGVVSLKDLLDFLDLKVQRDDSDAASADGRG